jgi:hypothetical protein
VASKFAQLFQAAQEPIVEVGSSSLLSLEDLFDEIPVSLDVFIRDNKYLGEKTMKLGPLQADAIYHIERVFYPELYPMLAEYNPYWSRDISMTNYHTIQWGKGSSHPDTLIYQVSSGKWVKLRDLKATKLASAYKEDGNIFAADCTDSFLEGFGSMFKVVTTSGQEIKVWEGHRFLTWGREAYSGGGKVPFAVSGDPKWQRLWDMKAGDHIGVSSTVPAPLNPIFVDPREIEIVGLRLGDEGKRAATKRVPEEFFSLSNAQIALLVSRLIDTDGWITDKCNTWEIGYGTISKGLAQDIQKLCMRLGVLMDLKEKKTKYKGEPYISYQLRVRDAESVEKLASQLTLLDKEPNRLAILEKVSKIQRRNAKHGDLVWDRIESIEYIGEGEYWTTTVDGPASYVSAGGFLNHNSGKDMISRMSCLRIAYLLGCMKSPQNYFGMPADDTINMLNVAVSAPQANRAFFTPMTRMVKRGWFKDKAEPTQGSIIFDKNVEAISGHSEAESQEGLNLILGVCDEIDAFKTREQLAKSKAARQSSKSAEAIMEMIESSAASRFPRTFKQVFISFPRYVGSTIQTLTAEAKRDIEKEGKDSPHYVSGPYCTWEVRPDKFQSDYAPQFKRDPRNAKSKYMCQPSFSINPYFKNTLAVEACCREEEPAIRISYRTDGNSWVPQYEFRDDFLPIVGAIYAMHADLAINGDRAGIAMSHMVRMEETSKDIYSEDGTLATVFDTVPIIKTDFVIAFESDTTASPPREIQIRWARDLWAELKLRGFNIRQFSFDSYQSASSRQELEALGVKAPLISTDKTEEPWRDLKNLFEAGRISIPKIELLLKEILGLSKMNGGKIDHDSGSSKDLADALACSVVGALSLKGAEDPSGAVAYFAKPEFISGGLPKSKTPIGFEDGLTAYGGLDLFGADEGMPGLGYSDSWYD